MRRPALLLGVLASALVITSARATAPPDQYAHYNRQDLIIHDIYTHLDWERGPTSGQVSQSGAAAYCAALHIPNDSGGPWRVPTYKELMTLVDETIEVGTLGIHTAIDLSAFPDVQPQDVVAAPYWTSSYTPTGSEGWCVNFTDGSTLTEPSSSANYVRCVRSTP
jgi:hypothetical protein